MSYNNLGDSMSKDGYIDLSDIKDDELDKTASFTDLMSRSERKAREKQKRQELKTENKQDEDILKLINENEQQEKKKTSNNKNGETDQLMNTINLINKKSSIDDPININSDITYNENVESFDDDITDNKKQKKYNIGHIIINGVFVITSIVYYIYSVIFTTYQNNEKFLFINSAVLLSMIILFCISIIFNKRISKFFSIINYILFLGFLIFNILINVGYIK